MLEWIRNKQYLLGSHPPQDMAVDRMLQHDHGVLSATTAFGKTVGGRIK
ncbi:hypothetical protein HMPREF1140_1256 [Lachnoanaerobaculum sp. ICM7]|nr:hypothetical protein HMPREF1140_1256 [Lachnoanaerobaculum sp. ICM7]